MGLMEAIPEMLVSGVLQAGCICCCNMFALSDPPGSSLNLLNAYDRIFSFFTCPSDSPDRLPWSR